MMKIKKILPFTVIALGVMAVARALPLEASVDNVLCRACCDSIADNVTVAEGCPAACDSTPEKVSVVEECPTRCDSIADEITLMEEVPGAEIEKESLILFEPELKNTQDRGMLEYIEEAIRERLRNGNQDNDRLLILQGGIADFHNIDQDTPVSISNYDGKQMRVTWYLGSKEVTVAVPIGYDTARKGTRAEIERDFIADIKKSDGKRKLHREIDREDLELYGDSLYVLPGYYYQKPEVNRNIFLAPGDDLTPVWDAEFPLESVADLLLYPSAVYGDISVELKIVKHEYGDSETINVPLNNILAVAEKDGCLPFWGVEKFSDGKLQGALFLYNANQGYDHIIRLAMTPDEIIAGTGAIQGRASLFVPTNNVDNLFEPYRTKTESEKIKYDK